MAYKNQKFSSNVCCKKQTTKEMLGSTTIMRTKFANEYFDSRRRKGHCRTIPHGV